MEFSPSVGEDWAYVPSFLPGLRAPVVTDAIHFTAEVALAGLQIIGQTRSDNGKRYRRLIVVLAELQGKKEEKRS